MRDQNPTSDASPAELDGSPLKPDASPPELLDEYLRLIRASARVVLPATAIRTRSLDARMLLARAALGDTGTLDELIAAARTGDHSWLHQRRRKLNTGVLAGLAQVLAMQDILPQDRTDGLALYELIRHALGAKSLSMGHQGLHAQLTFRWQGPRQAQELLTAYRGMTERIRTDLEIDLANPYAEPAVNGEPAGNPAQPWLAAFRQLLPEPWLTVDARADLPAFDGLGTGPVEKISAGPLVSVIVTSFRPDEGLITAVRSILAQSWTNTEVLVVDDASPDEFDPMIERCLGLDGRVRLVRLATNCGTYRARNAGLDAARGEFVTFQDSDDWSHPRRLELQVQPLLDHPDLVASTSDGMGVTDELLMTRPGVRSGRFNPSSLMFRRITVMRRIGYFDQMRKAADSEYIGRMRATFGEQALHHLDMAPLALIRLSLNSLSRSEIRAFWMHPGRVAYSSAYLRWHERIAAGTADPYRPADPVDRPFAAPGHLLRSGGTPAMSEHHDVVLATDWSANAGPQQSMLDELTALTGRGLRVGVLQLEAYLPMLRRRRPLDRAIQDLINSGTVTHVQTTDEADIDLLLIRSPAVLQFAGADRSALRVNRAVIIADQAPTGVDGTGWRYAPTGAAQAVRRIFGVEPQWCPQDAAVRSVLLQHLDASQFSGFELPAAIDWGKWTVPARTARGQRPVLGRDLRDNRASWPAQRAALLRSYPASATVDVRLRGGPDAPRALLDKTGLPAGWLVYGAADVEARVFLHQLDFYVDFPPANTAEAFSRAALEALAAGCVVVLPRRFAGTFGDAALYCEPGEVGDVVRRLWAAPESYAAQSRRGRDRVVAEHAPEVYADRIVALLTGSGTPADDGGARVPVPVAG